MLPDHKYSGLLPKKKPQNFFFRLLNSDLAKATVLYEVQNHCGESLGAPRHKATGFGLAKAQKTSCKNIIGNFGSDI